MTQSSYSLHGTVISVLEVFQKVVVLNMTEEENFGSKGLRNRDTNLVQWVSVTITNATKLGWPAFHIEI